MKCEEYSNRIKDLVENKLDEKTAEQVTLHLISCRNCEAEFENCFYQKEIYPNLLYGIEPPKDLPNKFQSRLETAENAALIADKTSAGWFEKLSKSFAFLYPNRGLAAAFALVLFAIVYGFFYFAGDKEIVVNNPPSPTISENPQTVSPAAESFETGKKKPFSVDSALTKDVVTRAKKSEIPQLKKEQAKLIEVKQPTEKKAITKREVSAKNVELSAEEQNQIAQIQSFETDAARQLEKTEILFRAFRNIHPSDETGRFDVDYEKRQSRKLLQNNVQLKQRAENYGTLLTEETLNKIEPLLLDIANLDTNPSAEQMSEIKDRFTSQKIIASLQGF